MSGGEVDSGIERCGEPAKQGDGRLGAVLFDVLDVVLGYRGARGNLRDGQVEFGADVVQGLAEGEGFAAFSSVSAGTEVAASITSTPVTAGTYYYLGWAQNFTGTGMSLYGIQNASGITLNGYNSQLIQLSGYTSWAGVTIGSLYVDAGSSGALHMHAR